MADTKSPELMKLYNLPQRVEGGIPIHGATLVGVDIKDPVLLFDHMDGMYANLVIQGHEDLAPVQLSATTGIIYDYETGKYSIASDEESE